jgi:regulator of sigma E protease
VLGVVVFVHEMGHFLAARWCGVAVETFSIGFGPEIAGFHDGRGTRWRVAWIPLGGYVKFKGDENAASLPSKEEIDGLTPEARRGNFHAAPLRHRVLIVSAGPLANFILAFLIFAVALMISGKLVADPRVQAVGANTPAERAGIQPGDRILQIGGTEIETFEDLHRIVIQSAGVELSILVERGGTATMVRATPELVERTGPQGQKFKVGILGITGPEGRRVYYGPLTAMRMALSDLLFWMKQPFLLIRDLIAGRGGGDQISGIIGIGQLAGDVASIGFPELIRLTAIISVSIGLLNLFPIPILDGGHLMYYGIEAILGRPLSQRSQEFGFRIGLALILMLMVFATWNDLSRIAAKL